jgi:glycosyltransferase involved in cell wall biosynthesis
VIGIVANLRPIKRIDVLVQAFALVCRRHPDARLVVVGGDGSSQHGASVRKELERLASRLAIADRVVFTGRVDDPAPYISRFSVAVLCSDSEGFSNSIIEYMHAGRPVVCTNTGGNPELVRDGHNGFLVPVGDIGALADRLLLLLSDSALANRMGEAARETVLSGYSTTRMVSEHMACYDELLAAGRSPFSFKGPSGGMHRC